MKILSLTTLTTVAATAAAQKYIDECSQYPTCAACLDVGKDALNAEGTGLLETAGNLTTRPNCGWCHFNIQYADGTTGARCADQRDAPWVCENVSERRNAFCGAPAGSPRNPAAVPFIWL